MFYNKQLESEREEYKKILSLIGNLTLIFSESDSPYLSYRAHENIFCKCFKTENLARSDCSADAKKGNIGIGLKTWVGRDDQKIAEFGKVRENYKDLKGIDLIKKIAGYRNERIRVTKKIHGIEEMIYHILKRVPGKMQIIECSFDSIDVENIKLIKNRGNNNNTYFNDGKHTYHFSLSKNTLYMIFDDYKILEEFEINIIANPYDCLENLADTKSCDEKKKFQGIENKDKLYLRLYASNSKKGKFVGEKSGLNQWNAKGRRRDPNEIYIAYPVEDRNRSKGFFPPRDKSFELQLPDGQVVSAKVCQSDGKAIMSNPNKVLGKWLLRDVFGVSENTLITYEMLEGFGVDSVIFTKSSNNRYKIDFSNIGTYEEHMEQVDTE